MNNEKRGNFLKKLRKSKKLTQFQLGELLNYSDKNISKWENGISFPTDPEVLSKLSEIFNVSLEELLYGDFKNESNEKMISENTMKIYAKNYKAKAKLKHLILLSVFFLLIFIIAFLISVYFNFIKGKIRVYKLTGETINGTILNSTLMISNDVSILNFNKLATNDDIQYINFYMLKEGKQIKIFSGSNDNYYIEEKRGSAEYNLIQLPYNDIFAKIIYKNGKEETINVFIEEKYSNDKVFPEKSINENPELIYNDYSMELNKLKFELENDYYVKTLSENVKIYFYQDVFELETINATSEIKIYKDLNSNGFIFEKTINGETNIENIIIPGEINCEITACKTIENFCKYLNFLSGKLQNET